MRGRISAIAVACNLNLGFDCCSRSVTLLLQAWQLLMRRKYHALALAKADALASNGDKDSFCSQSVDRRDNALYRQAEWERSGCDFSEKILQ